jgi:hypothetical protein
VPAARGLSQPCPHHAVDLAPLCARMLAVHPLPVQPDTELVHVQSSLDPRRFLVPHPLPRGLHLSADRGGV